MSGLITSEHMDAAMMWLNESRECDIVDRSQRFLPMEPVYRALAQLIAEREAQALERAAMIADKVAAAHKRAAHREAQSGRDQWAADAAGGIAQAIRAIGITGTWAAHESYRQDPNIRGDKPCPAKQEPQP